MKTLMIKIFILLFSLISITSCSNATEQTTQPLLEEPVIEYHNDLSTPLDTIKTLQYATYVRDKVLFLSCYSEKLKKRFGEFYKDDPNLKKLNRDIVYFDLNKANVRIYTFEKEERAEVKYPLEDKICLYLLQKDDNKWYISY